MAADTPHTGLPIDVKQLPVSELVSVHTAVVNELLARRVSRSRTSPTADLPVLLVATAYDGQLADRNQAWEVESPGHRIAVRGRLRLPTDRASVTYGPIADDEQVEVAVFVVIDASTCEVVSAVELPAAQLSRSGLGGATGRIRVDADLLGVEGARDVTADLEKALESVDAERFARRHSDLGSANGKARPTGWCLCGCGEQIEPGARFLVMHDRRAESPALRERYGTISGLVV